MPEWVSKIQCSKCKKTGHLAFNCPPKYNNIKRKSHKEDRYNKFNKLKKNTQAEKDTSDTNKTESAAVATVEFAGYVNVSRQEYCRKSVTGQNSDCVHSRNNQVRRFFKYAPKTRLQDQTQKPTHKVRTHGTQSYVPPSKRKRDFNCEMKWLTNKLYDQEYRFTMKNLDLNDVMECVNRDLPTLTQVQKLLVMWICKAYK